MESNDEVFIGCRNDGWSKDAAFGLDVNSRRQHVYVIGQTGTGKSTVLRNLIQQDIEAGRGIAVLDPHGDLDAKRLSKLRCNHGG